MTRRDATPDAESSKQDQLIEIEENKLLNLVKTLSEDKLTTKTTKTPVGKIVSKGMTGELTLTERLMEKKFTIRLSSRF